MEKTDFSYRVEEINKHICEKCRKRNKCADKTQNCNVKKMMWFLGNRIANRNFLKGK